MNAGIYKLIFSKRLNALVVVGEICSAQGKAPGTTRASKCSTRGMVQVIRILGMLSSGALMVSTAWATPAPDALPIGGQVVQGSASISQSGAQMDINQASQRAVINWQTFDVGADAKVHIIQPNQAAVLLNRVVTNKPSEIFGKIDANGQVVLVNNNGIVFGKDGSASAGSFTATTLDISDKDFMEGKTRFSSNSAQGEVVNHGTIEAKNGGYVALLGAKVTNDGKIITHNGSVALGAAESIAIPMTSSGKIKMQLSVGNLNAAVENTKNGVIVTEGGDVYLQAAAANNAMASIKHSGQIDTSGAQAGKAILLADSGEITVDGKITANSTDAANKGGDIIIGRDTETGVLAKTTDVSGASLETKKGFVETSAHQLKVDGIKVKAKEWLLDPDDIEITDDPLTAGYTTQVSTSTITNALNNGTDITLDTATGSTGVNGNILVTSAINATNTTNTDATLTLKANNGIKTNADIIGSTQAGSTGKIHVNMTALGAAGNADSGIKITKDINVTGSLSITGTNNYAAGAGVSIAPSAGLGGGTQTLRAGDDLTIIGTSNILGVSGYGVCISSCGPAAYAAITNITSSTGKVSITGNTQTSRGVSFGGGTGIGTHTYNISAAKNVEIKATTQGKQSGATAYGVFENVSAQLNLASTTGSILIDGDASADTLSTSGQGVGLQGNLSFAAANGSTISGKGRTTSPTTSHGAIYIATSASPNQLIDVSTGDLNITGSGGSYGVTLGTNPGANGSTTIKNDNRKITVTGTGTLSFGVGLIGPTTVNTKSLVIKGESTSNLGVAFSGSGTSGTGILVDTLKVDGKSASSHGVQFNNTNNIKANTLYQVNGESTSNGAGVLMVGTLNLTTPINDASGFFGKSAGTSGIGLVLGAQSGFTTNPLTVNATNGSFNVTGESESIGVRLLNVGDSTISAGKINITGSANTAAGKEGYGVLFQRYPRPVRLESTGDININGTVTGAGNGSGVYFAHSGWGPHAPSLTATGNITLRGNNRADANNSKSAIEITSGLQVSAGGNIVLQAETNNAAVAAINVYSVGSFASWSAAANVGAGALYGNMSLKSTAGDVLIQSNQGNIVLNNQLTSTLVNGTQTTSTDISGRNITIDNTGAGMATGAGTAVTGTGGTQGATLGLGSIDVTTGAITKGAGKATGNTAVVIDGRKVTASENINITGIADGLTASGVYNNKGLITATAGKVHVIGEASGSGSAVWNAGVITGGSVELNGTAKGQGIGVYSNSLGTLKSTVNDISIEGLSENGHGVYLDSTIDAVATSIASGSKGITIKGTSNSTANHYGVVSSKAITAESGVIDISGANKGTLNAVHIASTSPITAKKDKVSMTGNALGTASSTASGVYNYANIQGTSINIEGHSKAAAASSDSYGVFSSGAISSTVDDVSIKGTSTSSQGLWLQNSIVSKSAIKVSGSSTSTATTKYGVTNLAAMTANGVVDGYAIDISGSADSTSQAVYLGNAILNRSNDGATNVKATQGGIYLATDSSIINNSSAGIIKLEAGDGTATSRSKISAGGGATITQNSNAGITMTTDGVGDLTVAKTINSGSGNVIIGAGKLLAAGNGGGGQVKTVAGNTITNSSGKTYIYSGKASQTGTLSNLDSSLSELYLDSTTPTKAQNADSNVAYGSTIIGGGASQVMFREKVSVNLQQNLNGGIFNRTYGDEHTQNGQSSALWSDVQGVLKDANSIDGISNQLTSTMNDANGQAIKFHVSASTVIDSMSGAIQGDAYSTAGYLKANASGYGYSIPAVNDKYTVNFDPNNNVVKVVVGQKALTGSIAQGNTTYGDALVTGAVSLTNTIGADVVNVTGITIDTTGKTSTSGNLKAGTHTGLQSVAGIDGADAANYTFADVKGDYNVAKKVLTGSIAQGNTTYGDALQAGAASLTNTVGTDVVNVTGVTIDTTGKTSTSTSGNLKAGTHTGVQSVAGIDGADAANYTFADVKGDYNVAKKALTGASIVNAGNVYGGSVAAGAVNLNGANIITGDNVSSGTASVVSTIGDLSTSGNLKAGSYNQKISSLSGTDAGNYDFSGVTSAGNYTVTKKDASILTDGNTVVFNGSQQTDTVTKKGFIDGDKVGTVIGAGTGSQVGSYAPDLELIGDKSDLGNYNLVYGDAKFVIADVTPAIDPNLINPVPVNPNYKSPDSNVSVNELVTTQHNNEQIQKQCSLEFAKECKVQPTVAQEIAPRYVTFY